MARHGLLLGLAVVSFLLGFAALAITDPSSGVAIWWPAGGVGALMVLLRRSRPWPAVVLVALVGILSNLAVGRSPSFAITAAVILAIEVVVFLIVLRPPRQGALLSTMRGFGRFLVAVGAASLTIGIEGAVSLWWLAGIDPLRSFLALLPSHASALLLIVPLALVPLRRRGEPIHTARVIEGAVQLALTVGLSLLVFSPWLPVPLLFTLFPLLAWAASRFTPLFVVVELIVVALIVPTLTVLAGGPFGSVQGYVEPGRIVQVFMLSAAITALALAVVRSERERLVAQRERQAALMRGGFLGSQVGFLVARARSSGELQVLEANATATEIIELGWLPTIVGDWLERSETELSRELTLPDGRTWQVFGSLVPAARGERVFGIQLVDVSDHAAARAAMSHAVDRERAVADELRGLARQKDDFVSAVSHELRTPITSILGFAEDLEELVDERGRQHTEVIVRNANRLAAMVEQLLELGRMTAPNPVRSSGVVDLNQIVAESVEDQTRSAAATRVRVETALDERLPLVAGDDSSLGRVVTNLLSNAIKFTPPDGLVRLTTSVSTDQGRATLLVDDSGIGINESDRAHIFERFFRSSDESKLSAPGTGLGLAIVSSLVEIAGGTILVGDSPLGGTRFTIELPLAEHAAPTA